MRYKLNGKEDALGWESQGWTEKKVATKLAELKEASKNRNWRNNSSRQTKSGEEIEHELVEVD